MFKIVANLLMHKQLNFEEGSIQLLKQNVAIFPFTNLYYIQKIIEDSGKTQELYLAAKELGKEWIKNLFKEYEMKTIREQAEWGHNVFTLAGMGKMKVTNWDVQTKQMIYRVDDSVMAKYYGRVGRAVDIIPRGWFAGASCVFFQTDVDAVEFKCKSKGDDYCEVITQPKDKFDFNDPVVNVQLRNPQSDINGSK